MAEPSRKLLDAVTALLVEDGFEGVSVRKVASRAGVSIGAVQHHFPTKDAMLLAAMDHASLEFQQRLAEQVPENLPAAEALRRLCRELLGARPEQRSASVLWVARLARAEVDPTVAAVHAREWAKLADGLTALMSFVRADQDRSWVEDRAAGLLALIDGLAVTVLREPDRMPADRAERILAAALDDLLGD